MVPFPPVILLATCHAFFTYCSLWAFCTSLILSLCINVFPVNIIHVVLSLSSLVFVVFLLYVSVVLQDIVAWVAFFVQYSWSPKASSVFFKDNFMQDSHRLPLCYDSSCLLFLQIPFPEGSQNCFGFLLCINLEVAILYELNPVTPFWFCLFSADFLSNSG